MGLLPLTPNPKKLSEFLCNCISARHQAYPDMTVVEILAALEEIRVLLTEQLIEKGRLPPPRIYPDQ